MSSDDFDKDEKNWVSTNDYIAEVWELIFLASDIHITLDFDNMAIDYFPDENIEFMDLMGIKKWACEFGPHDYYISIEMDQGLVSELLGYPVEQITLSNAGFIPRSATFPNFVVPSGESFHVESELSGKVCEKGAIAYERLGNITWYCTEDWDKLSLAELNSFLIKLNNYSDEDFEDFLGQLYIGPTSITESLHVFE